MPGNSFIQEVLSNLRPYLIFLSVIAILLNKIFRVGLTLRFGLCAALAAWLLAIGNLYLLRMPDITFEDRQQALVESCFTSDSSNMNAELFQNLPQSDLVRVSKYSDFIYAVSAADVWTKKDYYVQTIMLRRFAKFIRHDDQPYVVDWNGRWAKWNRKLGGLIFQARLHVIAETPNHLVLGRGAIETEAGITKACL